MCSKTTINILRNRKRVSQSLEGSLVNLVPYSGQVRGSGSTLAAGPVLPPLHALIDVPRVAVEYHP